MYSGALIVLLLGMSSALSAVDENDGLSIIGTRISGLFVDSGAYYYNRIYDQLIDGYEGRLELTMSPIRRASSIFSRGRADCLFIGTPRVAAYTENGLSEDAFIFTKAINVTNIKAYTAAGKSPVESLEEFTGGVITVDGGIGDDEQIHGQLPDNAKTIVSPSLRHGFRMLDLGRTKILLAYELDVEQLKKDDPSYGRYSVSNSFVVDSSEDVIVCLKSDRAENFIRHVDGQITKLQEKGELQ